LPRKNSVLLVQVVTKHSNRFTTPSSSGKIYVHLLWPMIPLSLKTTDTTTSQKEPSKSMNLVTGNIFCTTDCFEKAKFCLKPPKSGAILVG